MKTRKRDFIPFSPYDFTGMERLFEKRAAQGWILEKVSSLGWTYRRSEPQALRFTVCCYPRASQFEPEPTQDQLTFQDFCAHTGWTLAACQGPIQIFYNAQPDPVPIDTDPNLEINAISRMMRRVIPAYLILLVLGFLMGGSWCYTLVHDPIDLLASPTSLFTGFCWLMLFLYFAADLTSYFTWRRRARRAAQVGEFVPTRGCHMLLMVTLGAVILGLIYWFLTARLPWMRLIMLAMLLSYALIFGGTQLTKELLRRRKVSAKVNRAVTLTVDAVLALLVMGGLTAGLFWAAGSGRLTIFQISEIPLEIGDLIPGAGAGYIGSESRESSLFLSKLEFRNRPGEGVQEWAGKPWLEYTLLDVHLSGLYGWCLDQLLHAYDDYGVYTPEDEVQGPYYVYQSIDPQPWGAREAYQLWSYGEPRDRYLLCWEGRLVTLEADWTLTREQMAVAGELLAP